ncbi:hypothetical protein ARMGADRAFT_1025198 [Armillaria gallica]|uniref:Ribonuclease H1 N-terminal domain-containing protein n=1 Tax=Armillaria gallica TaxID=47427 RepID=A0A2H3EKX7_ARMGA|nr:hypothetical protein ARMGADRAFT_1025198 [Armillaria gallica]
MHKLDEDKERLWDALEDFPLDAESIYCMPYVPVFYLEKGDENLIHSGGKKLYVVRRGFVLGIYSDWRSTQKQVLGFSDAQQESFSTWSNCLVYWQAECKPGNHKCKHRLAWQVFEPVGRNTDRQTDRKMSKVNSGKKKKAGNQTWAIGSRKPFFESQEAKWRAYSDAKKTSTFYTFITQMYHIKYHSIAPTAYSEMYYLSKIKPVVDAAFTQSTDQSDKARFALTKRTIKEH